MAQRRMQQKNSKASALAASDLARSGITAMQAEAAGIFSVDDASTLYPEFKSLPAIVIPYYDPRTGAIVTFGSDANPFCRVRYLPTTQTQIYKKPLRYMQPRKSGTFAYFPQVKDVIWKDILNNSAEPLVITEGEKKALSACLQCIPTVGLGGVYNFMRQDELLPELQAVAWSKRQVYICFDSDIETNPNIQAAEGKLAVELGAKRGAQVYRVRLPAGADGAKQGLDDVIVSDGRVELLKHFKAAHATSSLDKAVLSLNEHVAWIESEGAVYDIHSKELLRPSVFTKGSKYSAISHFVIERSAKNHGAPRAKKVSVADTWLTHPYARRYADLAFLPDEAKAVVPGYINGELALNMWTGWEPRNGDVSPWLRLMDHVFAQLPPHLADFPIKWAAHKVQNPAIKTPLALVLIGPQGGGKSLWAESLRLAFGQYGVKIPSSALLSPFNGWIERSLLAVIDEAEARHVACSSESGALRALISEKRAQLNEKFRPARQIDTYTQYILTSNQRKVGAFAADDRRMFVADCAEPSADDTLYHNVLRWNEEDGPAKLLGYLLAYDLKGWTPPSCAPMTAEKYMAYMESLTPLQRIAEEMQTAGKNIVQSWIEQALVWARQAEIGNNPAQAALAKEISDSMTRIQIRPWYTPEELVLMFPAISGQLHGVSQKGQLTPGELSRQLRETGIRYLMNSDDPRGFRWQGMLRQYLIVSDTDKWHGTNISQNEFERLMHNFPRWRDKP